MHNFSFLIHNLYANANIVQLRRDTLFCLKLLRVSTVHDAVVLQLMRQHSLEFVSLVLVFMVSLYGSRDIQLLDHFFYSNYVSTTIHASLRMSTLFMKHQLLRLKSNTVES